MFEFSQLAPSRGHRFDSITRRFVLGLALLPIVPASSAIIAVLAENYAPIISDSSLRYHTILTILWTSGFILIWRRAIIWTLGRSALTAVVSVTPFIQIVVNKPLWNAGCISDDFLRAGQHYMSCGVWTWLVVWVWWGAEKYMIKKSKSLTVGQSARFRWLAPLGASLGLLPAIFGFWMIVGIYLQTNLNIPWSGKLVFWNYLIPAIVALASWFLIWRKTVTWSERVIWVSLGAWVLVVGLPIAGQFFLLRSGSSTIEVTIVSLPVIGWGVWMAWTMWYWPMRVEAGVAEGPSCMNCGYSLRGLTATRCPECGDEPTLDQLWAANFLGSF